MIQSMWWRRLPSPGVLLVPGFCIGLVALMWVGLFQRVAFERRRAIEQREEAHDNLARLFEEHVIGVLTSASITLREIESEYRRQGRRLDLAKYFHDRPELRPYRKISVVDRDGRMVLMTTGYVRPEDEERARAVGIRQVILKPNTIDEMALALDRLFTAAQRA